MNDIICGDALTILRTLPDGCARCCVTSPPYFNLRDYGVPGQIGLEPTMGEYITRLVEVFIEVKRVLSSDGTLWLNMADSYAGSGKGWSLHPTAPEKNSKQRTNIGSYRIESITKNKKELPGKNLMGIPWRVAFALQDSGWILRQDIIWSKSNCMPESVRDRCTKSHEYIFLFAKQQKYYFNQAAIKETTAPATKQDVGGSVGAFGCAQSRRRRDADGSDHCGEITEYRNKRSVWTMPTTGGANKYHYATFPDDLAATCILAGTAEGDIVLDPFAGTGTTCRIANKYGRQYVGIDINPEYCDAARAEIPLNLF